MAMEWLFGKQLTPKEMLAENQKAIRTSIRELEREVRKMEQQEKKLIVDIRKNAAAEQMGAVKIMAQDLVRTRRHIQKMCQMKTRLQAVSLRLQSVSSQAAMADAMKGVTRAMVRMNRQINLPGLQHVMMEFERQSQIMDMKQEIIDDTMEDMWDDEGEQEETDEIVNQVLDEIGINMNKELVAAPATKVAATTKEAPRQALAAEGGGSDADRDLQARLDMLKNK